MKYNIQSDEYGNTAGGETMKKALCFSIVVISILGVSCGKPPLTVLTLTIVYILLFAVFHQHGHFILTIPRPWMRFTLSAALVL